MNLHHFEHGFIEVKIIETAGYNYKCENLVKCSL